MNHFFRSAQEKPCLLAAWTSLALLQIEKLLTHALSQRTQLSHIILWEISGGRHAVLVIGANRESGYYPKITHLGMRFHVSFKYKFRLVRSALQKTMLYRGCRRVVLRRVELRWYTSHSPRLPGPSIETYVRFLASRSEGSMVSM
ncbi:hypothetical protein N431DRAFT_117753 [Stipitochalara longipes BDJ]|nr:hypothetical protein N431DRAFT_117753 [Stipitochalara longipes BDJ]